MEMNETIHDAGYSHLLPSIRADADLPNEQRFRIIQDARWINYPRARAAHKMLDEVMNYPKRDRMRNLLLVGPSANGKTMIIRKYKNRYPDGIDQSGQARVLPILMVQMSASAGLPLFYRKILHALGAPSASASMKLDRLEHHTLDLIRRVNVRMIIIDEIHNLLGFTFSHQRQTLNLLKFLGNELQIPIVVVGTEEAYNAIKTDPQTANRFEPFEMPLWTLNDELLQLLMTLEQSLPLRRASRLGDESIAEQVLSQTDGTIGAISRLIEQAAIEAIVSGREQITQELIASLPSSWAFGRTLNVSGYGKGKHMNVR